MQVDRSENKKPADFRNASGTLQERFRNASGMLRTSRVGSGAENQPQDLSRICYTGSFFHGGESVKTLCERSLRTARARQENFPKTVQARSGNIPGPFPKYSKTPHASYALSLAAPIFSRMFSGVLTH